MHDDPVTIRPVTVDDAVAAALHDEPASLWVWQDNPRAHAFYARNGFAPDGGRRVHEPWSPAPIVRLVR